MDHSSPKRQTRARVNTRRKPLNESGYAFSSTPRGARAVLFSPYYRGLVPPSVPAGSTGRTHVPSAGMDENAGCRLLVLAGHHAGSHPDGHFHSRESAARIGKSDLKGDTGTLLAGFTTLPEIPQDHVVAQFGIPGGDVSLDVQDGQSVHAALV